MMEDLTIKLATESDAEIIFDFIIKLAEYEKLSHEVTTTADNLRLSLFSEDNTAQALICYHKQTPIGFALFFYNFSTFIGKKGMYLEDLFVHPEFRNYGAGKKMLKYLAKIAIEKDCGRFEWSVLDWNEPAINFYKSIGAEFKKEWIITRITGEKLNKLTE